MGKAVKERRFEDSVFDPQFHKEIGKKNPAWVRILVLEEFLYPRLSVLLRELRQKGFVTMGKGSEYEDYVNEVFEKYEMPFRMKLKVIDPKTMRYVLCEVK